MLAGKLLCFGKCGLALLAAFLPDDLVGDVVPDTAGLGGFADVAGFLVEPQYALCDVGPVIGPGFRIWWLVIEVTFPLVFAVNLLPGYIKDDLKDVTELLDADRGVAVHCSPF